MTFDPNTFFAALSTTIRAQKPFQTGLREMIDWCAQQAPHADWEKVSALPFADDEKKAAKWIPDVLKKYPAPFEVRGLYFGLAEMANAKDEEFADLYVAFMGQYDPADKEAKWVFGEKRHYPEASSLRVKTLKAAGLIFNRESGEGLGNTGNYLFCMSYTLLLVTSLMTSELYGRLGGSARGIGILAGWDSGDLVRPGELTARGFVPNPEEMV